MKGVVAGMFSVGLGHEDADAPSSTITPIFMYELR